MGDGRSGDGWCIKCGVAGRWRIINVPRTSKDSYRHYPYEFLRITWETKGYTEADEDGKMSDVRRDTKACSKVSYGEKAGHADQERPYRFKNSKHTNRAKADAHHQVNDPDPRQGDSREHPSKASADYL